jgi:alpha-1,6-mannosyltransferase
MAQPGAGNPGRHAWIAPAAAVAGFLAFAVVAGAPGSPFQPELPAAAAGGPFAALARALGLDRLGSGLLVAVGVSAGVLAVLTFLWLLRAAWRGEVSARFAAGLVVVLHLVVVLALPLLFSRDVYSYAYEGRIRAVYGANPYVQTPLDFPGDPLWRLVGPTWVDTPAVYGPAFTSLAAAAVRLFESTTAQVMAFRVIAAVASLATTACIWWTCRRLSPERTAFGVLAFGANPAVLFLAVASGHNDLLVALAVAGAFALVVRLRLVVALAVLTVGALVKASAALPLVLLLVWLVAVQPRGRRLRTALASFAMVVGIAAVFGVPYLQWQDPTLGQIELAGHEGGVSPSLWVQRWVDRVSFASLGTVARIAIVAALIGLFVLLVRWTWRRAAGLEPAGVGASWAWSLFLLTLLGPVLLPWYATWTLPFAWLVPRSARRAIVGTSVLLVFSQWTTEPFRAPGTFGVNVWVNGWILIPACILLGAFALRDLWPRVVGPGSLHEEEQVAGQGRREGRDRGAEAAGQWQPGALQPDG